MKTSTKRGLIFSLMFIFTLLNLFFVSAEEGIKISKFSSSYLLFFLLPIILAIIAFLVTLLFMKGKLIDMPWLKGVIIGFIAGVVYSITRYKLFLISSYIGWLPILFSIIIFMLIFIMFSNLKNPSITFTKKVFWIGLVIAFIILYYAGNYTFTNTHRADYHENIFYTFLFVVLAIIIPLLIGFTAQKIKEKSGWQNWSYTKKGFVIGLISSIGVLITYGFFVILDKRVSIQGIISVLTDGSIIFIVPLFLSTIIGWIIQKIKSQ